MKPLLLFALALTASAQPTITTTGPATAQPGQTITLTLTLTNAAAANLSAVGWTDSGAATATPAAVALGKSVSCFNGVCLVIGAIGTALTNNPLPDGPVATIAFTVPATAPLNAALPVTLTNVGAVNTAGTSVTLTTGLPYAVQVVPSSCDVNADGKVDGADVGQMVNAAIGKVPCPLAAGKQCSLFNTMVVLLGAISGSCGVMQ